MSGFVFVRKGTNPGAPELPFSKWIVWAETQLEAEIELKATPGLAHLELELAGVIPNRRKTIRRKNIIVKPIR